VDDGGGCRGRRANRRLTDQPQPLLYRPLGQSSDLSMALLLRTLVALRSE
jgi:hypothetical protein